MDQKPSARAGGPPGLSIESLLGEYDRALEYTDALIAGLDADQVQWRPEENASAIGWHLIHQPAVAHFMIRNLTAAEPRIDDELERLADSATPPKDRGVLPSLDRTLEYRATVAGRVRQNLGAIAAGDVGAPRQLTAIGIVMLTAIINHEYQHSTWVAETRENPHGLVVVPAPQGGLLVDIDGYPVIRSADDTSV